MRVTAGCWHFSLPSRGVWNRDVVMPSVVMDFREKGKLFLWGGCGGGGGLIWGFVVVFFSHTIFSALKTI